MTGPNFDYTRGPCIYNAYVDTVADIPGEYKWRYWAASLSCLKARQSAPIVDIALQISRTTRFSENSVRDLLREFHTQNEYYKYTVSLPPGFHWAHRSFWPKPGAIVACSDVPSTRMLKYSSCATSVKCKQRMIIIVINCGIVCFDIFHILMIP